VVPFSVPDTLTLIRHGLTPWNETGRFQGHADPPLSDAGRTQAERLKERVASTFPQPAAVYSSPLQRARETATIAFGAQPVTLDERLKEIHFGDFEGSTRAENERHPAWAEWSQDPYHRAPPKGESYKDLRVRVAAWLEVAHAVSGHVVAVAHSGTIQMVLAELLGLTHPQWDRRMFVRHSSITRVLYTDHGWMIERINDTRHLDESGVDPYWHG
jgi:broad specificity phosphatase PhoE